MRGKTFGRKKLRRKNLLRKVFTIKRIVMLVIVFTVSLFSYYANCNFKEPKKIIIYLSDMITTQHKINNNTNNKIKQNSNYSKELEKIFYNKKGQTLDYRGYCEYGYYLKINNIRNHKGILHLDVKGELNDAVNFADIKGEYSIDENKVTEDIKVNYSYPDKKEKNTLNSIIPKKVVLKLPLEEKNTWHQKFNYKGITYDSINEITKIYNYKGKKAYEVVTIVKDIEGFPEKFYKEKRVYCEEKGLVEFSMTIPQKSSYVTSEKNLIYRLNEAMGNDQ